MGQALGGLAGPPCYHVLVPGGGAAGPSLRPLVLGRPLCFFVERREWRRVAERCRNHFRGWGWRAGWGAGQPGERRGSVEATAPQVFGDDDVCHGVEDELDVVGVGGTGDVGIDLLVGGLVLALVLGLDVSHGFREGAGACGRDADGSG